MRWGRLLVVSWLLPDVRCFLPSRSGLNRLVTSNDENAKTIPNQQHPHAYQSGLHHNPHHPTFQSDTQLSMAIDAFSSTEMLSFLETLNLNIDRDQAEALAGPFFGASLFPYLAFLFFLNVEENKCPKGKRP